MSYPCYLLTPLLFLAAVAFADEDPDLSWPEADAETRPWLRWWWPSSGQVEDLSGELEEIHSVGFGGVEVIPLTDDFASLWPGPAWTESCAAASRVCEKLGIGFDISTQQGRAPAVPPDLPDWMERSMEPLILDFPGGQVSIPLPEGEIDCIGAWPPVGPPTNLASFITEAGDQIEWNAPAGPWTVYGTPSQPNGPHLDPFSKRATKAWLERFDDIFRGYDGPFPRCRTLERTIPTKGNWSSELFDTFQIRRGYDLREQLPALLGEANPGTIDRVVSDYRETLADMHYEALVSWHDFTRDQGSLSRSLLAGNPGNPIDLHSVADIPGNVISDVAGENPPVRLFFASAAAHFSYKPIVQASYRCPAEELLTPAKLKSAADLLWLAGANQLIVEGRQAGSSQPGGSLDPGTGLWRQIDSFASYATRCQSILQSGVPNPDLLLYFPAHDFWVERGGIPDAPSEREEWLKTTGFHRSAQAFINGGIAFDAVSDRMLRQAVVGNGRIILGGLSYDSLILPEIRRLPESTATLLLELCRRGAKIGILGEWPRDVPGFPLPDIRRGTMISALQNLPSERIAESHDPIELAIELGTTPEPMASSGLRFVRRSHFEGHHYFVVNRSKKTVREWVRLSTPARSALFMDPRFPKRSGMTTVRHDQMGPEIFFNLAPGESRILRTFGDKTIDGPGWTEYSTTQAPVPVAGIWNVEFLEGQPTLPAAFATPMLGSWKTLSDPIITDFTGTARYTIEFELPEGAGDAWQLDLGQVAHSARIHINGLLAGTAYAPPHCFDVGQIIKKGRNTLSIEVSSLLGATTRSSHPAGLLGPVRLIPMSEIPIEPQLPDSEKETSPAQTDPPKLR